MNENKTDSTYSYVSGRPTLIDFQSGENATTRIMRYDYPYYNCTRLEKLLHLLPEPGHQLNQTEANILVWTYRDFIKKYIPISRIAKEIKLNQKTVSTAIDYPSLGEPSTILAIAEWLFKEIVEGK